MNKLVVPEIIVELKCVRIGTITKKRRNISCGGGIRETIFINDIVVKIDLSHEPSSIQAQAQIEAFHEIDKSDRVYIEPLIAWGNDWVAQRLISFSEKPTSEMQDAIAEALFCKYGWYDFHDGNYGRRKNGRLVIFDYGR